MVAIQVHVQAGWRWAGVGWVGLGCRCVQNLSRLIEQSHSDTLPLPLPIRASCSTHGPAATEMQLHMLPADGDQGTAHASHVQPSAQSHPLTAHLSGSDAALLH